MRKLCLLNLISLLIAGFCTASIDVRVASNAPNIIRFTPDSLLLVSGHTRQFSVDSPKVRDLFQQE